MVRQVILSSMIYAVFCAGARAEDPTWIARGRAGMVASDSPEASRIGADVLRAGGNAFDAAVATSFALSVSRPQSTGLGGGGFMVAYIAAEKRFVALDFRETAPAGATAARYARLFAERGDGASPSVYGGNAVGTPGQLAGLTEIRRRYGTRELRDLLAPAIRLAEDGFAVDRHYRDAVRKTVREFEKWPDLSTRHAAIYETLLGNGKAPSIGQMVRRPALARSLREIAEKGPAAIYGGRIGQALERAAQEAGGTLTIEDLRGYRVREREPVRTTFAGHAIISMPLPSSGGLCLAEILNIVEAAALRSDLHPEESRTHVLIEAMKHAFADRARTLGDPDFADVSVAPFLDKTYAAELARRIDPARSAPSRTYGRATAPEDRGTSHFCVVDRLGNVVALTETINGTFGSLVVVEPFGIILNNQMDDFLTARGQANLYGLVQSDANRVGPGKRPLSSMSPTIVMKDGRPVLVLGASGGPRIISSVLQVLLNVIQREMPLDEAIAALRVHHQWMPDEVFFDRDPSSETADRLRSLGHTIARQRRTGIVQAIRMLEDGTLVGAGDPRKGGRPAGVP